MFKNAALSLSDMLTKDEKLLAQTSIHWGVYWIPAAVIFIGFIIALNVVEVGGIVMIFGLMLLARAVLHKNLLLCAITNKRVLMRYGILQIDVVDMRFKHIESIELERMLPGLVMGYCTLQIMGTGQRIVRIPYVGNGPDLRRIYNELTLEDDEK